MIPLSMEWEAITLLVVVCAALLFLLGSWCGKIIKKMLGGTNDDCMTNEYYNPPEIDAVDDDIFS
jgi:hypothetical protein